MVSVILPIRHNEDISGVLNSIKDSPYPDIEVIVVDEGLERSAQRNIGIKQAAGGYLLVLDSDQQVSPGLIGECVELMKCGFGGVYIPEIIKTKGLFAYIRNWERQFYTGTPVDCVRFVRREGCPMFDETMNGPEDADWDRQIKGWKVVSKSPLYHYEKPGVISFFKKKVYYSRSMNKFAKKWPNDKVLNFWYRCFFIFLERSKWRRFLSRPDLAVCVMGIMLVRGIIYLCRR